MDPPLDFGVFAIKLIIVLACSAGKAKRLLGFVLLRCRAAGPAIVSEVLFSLESVRDPWVSVAPAYSNRAFAMRAKTSLVWTVLRKRDAGSHHALREVRT
jgi:hypothetical protein